MYEELQDELDRLARLRLGGGVHLKLNRSHAHDLIERAYNILALRYQHVPERSLEALAAAMNSVSEYNIPVFINRIENAFVIAEQPANRKTAPLKANTDKLLDALKCMKVLTS